MATARSIWSLHACAAVALSGCSSSTAPQTSAPDAAVADGAAQAFDSSVPRTSACAGDPTRCLGGTFNTTGFTGAPTLMKVELYRVFPAGTVAPIQSTILADDATFAFSNLDSWGHYYLKGVAGFGTGTVHTASVGVLRGRFAIPSTGGPIAIVMAPAQFELLEAADTHGDNRALKWVSAHAFDPATGKELTNATVSFVQPAAMTAMPYGTNAGGTKSYFFAFPAGSSLDASAQFQVTASAAGGAPMTASIATEVASSPDVTISSPSDGQTIPSNQPLEVTWSIDGAADYALVTFFLKQGTGFTSRFASASALAADVAAATVPASALAAPGTYLLNVNGGHALCGSGANVCAYLLQADAASLIAQ